MGVIAGTHASKKPTGTESNTGTRERQRNFGPAPAVVCNLKAHCMGGTIRAHVSKKHTVNERQGRHDRTPDNLQDG